MCNLNHHPWQQHLFLELRWEMIIKRSQLLNLSSVKQESACSLPAFSSCNSDSSCFWHQPFPLLANKVSILHGPFAFTLHRSVCLWFRLLISVMLAITVLLKPKNGSFASGEIEEYIFFTVTFQILFKTRSPEASTIRDWCTHRD